MNINASQIKTNNSYYFYSTVYCIILFFIHIFVMQN